MALGAPDDWHDYDDDGFGCCDREGCGLPKQNWRHAERESAPDITEPIHQQLTIPVQRRKTARPRKAARARTPRRAARY